MKTVILVPHYGMGHAPPELPTTLLCKYLQLIEDQEPLPAAICFYTEGVKLVVEGSPAIEHLLAVEAKGVSLIVCKTCLDFFGITNGVMVGTVAGMPDIIDAQWNADRVITL
jgi:intracellular sulfur oxidation DsrE/DsrF family protein